LITGEESAAGIFDRDIHTEIIEKARAARSQGRSRRFTLERPGGEEIELFVEVLAPPPTLVIVGGVHIAIALVSLASTLGFRTVVVDPRQSFGSLERFPHADQLIQSWPQKAFAQIDIDERTAVAMLTHDPKIDDPALQIALKSPAFYVGALGSQRTQAKRRQRLLDSGLSAEQIGRLHGPIGLDIGGVTPEEIALAVLAEIVAVQHQ
jgi:xanthine dehydrogenase accessory factor